MPEIAYATDEDIALRASADFVVVCPRDQKLASGTDGSFDPNDRWTLRSASTDFAAQGVRPGHVIQLLGPASRFRPPGEALVVASVAANTATLKRKGQAAGEGQPPSTPAGLTGVEFLVATLTPQIVDESIRFAGLFGISRADPTGITSDPGALRDLRDIVVLAVLLRQYRDMSREMGGPNPDILAAKALAAKSELDERIARAAVRGRAARFGPGDAIPARFAARITR